jgi:hypothetical protein
MGDLLSPGTVERPEPSHNEWVRAAYILGPPRECWRCAACPFWSNGKTYAAIRSNDVILPEGIATIPGPDPKYDFYRSIELSKLKEVVRQITR